MSCVIKQKFSTEKVMPSDEKSDAGVYKFTLTDVEELPSTHEDHTNRAFHAFFGTVLEEDR
jgi:hypothetical protein